MTLSGILARTTTGCSKRPSSKAAADESTGGVAPGYVEDAFEARTQLADFFSVLLHRFCAEQQQLPLHIRMDRAAELVTARP